MKEKRTIALMTVLLLLLTGILLRPYVEAYLYRLQHPISQPLEGDNKVALKNVVSNPDGSYTAQIEYFYRGDAAPHVMLQVKAAGDNEEPRHVGFFKMVSRGGGTVNIVFHRPSDSMESFVTRKVIVRLGDRLKPLAAASIDKPIEWPDSSNYLAGMAASKKTPGQLYQEAVELIDQGQPHTLSNGKALLEQLLLRDSNHLGAQIELARHAMKTRWGPEGLGQAEKYLKAVLAQDKEHVNAKVLLGYVYAHQGRYRDAETELSQAAALGTNNLWLWANWGELLAMQKKDDLAIEKYLLAVSGERPFNTYDRARLDSYANLFILLERKKQFERMEALYQQRLAEYATKRPCLRVEHARFRVSRFADYQGAISQATTALNEGCTSSEARTALGVAHYLAWADLAGDAKVKARVQAQVFLPEGPGMLYELARQDSTQKVVSQLMQSGVSIRLQDNDKLNALAYALMGEDIESSRRLLRLGAKGTDPVGAEGFPVALIPLMNQSVPGVLLMQQSGVNYSKIRFNGTNAVDIARRMGNPALLKALEQGSGTVM